MYFIYNYTYIFEIRIELQMSTLNKNSKDQQIIKDNNGKKSQSKVQRKQCSHFVQVVFQARTEF